MTSVHYRNQTYRDNVHYRSQNNRVVWLVSDCSLTPKRDRQMMTLTAIIVEVSMYLLVLSLRVCSLVVIANKNLVLVVNTNLAKHLVPTSAYTGKTTESMMRTRVMRTIASMIVTLGKGPCLSKFISKVCSFPACRWVSRENIIEAIIRKQTHKSRHGKMINYSLSIICCMI